MIERTTNRDTVIAGSLWTAVAALFIVAGAVMALGDWEPALLVGEAACAVSAFAAVRHVRCYAVRICEMVRRLDRDLAGRPLEHGAADARPTVPVQRIH